MLGDLPIELVLPNQTCTPQKSKEYRAPGDIHRPLLNIGGDQTADVSTGRWVVSFSSGNSNMKGMLWMTMNNCHTRQ